MYVKRVSVQTRVTGNSNTLLKMEELLHTEGLVHVFNLFVC